MGSFWWSALVIIKRIFAEAASQGVENFNEIDRCTYAVVGSKGKAESPPWVDLGIGRDFVDPFTDAKRHGQWLSLEIAT